MVLAGNRVIENGGGLAIALEGKVLADLPLPIGGLMADEPVEVVDEKLEHMKNSPWSWAFQKILMLS